MTEFNCLNPIKGDIVYLPESKHYNKQYAYIKNPQTTPTTPMEFLRGAKPNYIIYGPAKALVISEQGPIMEILIDEMLVFVLKSEWYVISRSK
jgi:hypothetical protein